MGRFRLIVFLFSIATLVIFLFDHQGKDHRLLSLYQENLQGIYKAHQAILNEFDVGKKSYTDEEKGFFIYKQGDLISWSDNGHYPDYDKISKKRGTFIHFDQSGCFLISRKLDTNGFEIIKFTVLDRRFLIDNDFLGAILNERIFGDWQGSLTNIVGRELKISDRLSVFLTMDKFFSLRYRITTYVMLWCCFILISLLIINEILRLRSRFFRGLLRFFGFLLLSLFIFLIPVPIDNKIPFLGFTFQTWDILSVSVLINLFLITGKLRFSFIWNTFRRFKKTAFPFWAFVYSISILITFFFLHFLKALLIRNDIVLDITKTISLDHLGFMFFFLFLSLGLLLLWCQHILLRFCCVFMTDKWTINFCIVLVSIIAFFSPLIHIHYVVLPNAFLFLFTINSHLPRTLRRLTYSTFLYVIILLLFGAFITSTAVVKKEEYSERMTKTEFAYQTLSPRDMMLENRLQELGKRFVLDYVTDSKSQFAITSISNLKSKISANYFSPFRNKYEIELTLYDSLGYSLQNPKDHISDYLEKIEYGLTNNKGIYFLKNWENLGRDKYVLWIPLGFDYGLPRKGIMLELMQKKIIPNTVYPSLLTNNQDKLSNYGYAIIKNEEMVASKEFELKMDFSQRQWKNFLRTEQSREYQGYHILAKRLDNTFIIVVGLKYSNQAYIANFSLHFLIGLLVGALVFVAAQFYNNRRNLTLSNRIQMYLGFTFIIPLLFLNIWILSLLNSSYRWEIIKNYQKRLSAVATNIYADIKNFNNGIIDINQLQKIIMDAGAFSRTDLNLYSSRGHLILSSQPDIFEKKLISGLIDPKSFKAVINDPEKIITTEEQVGKLVFKSVYVGIVDQHKGQLLGIIAMPFFDSKNHLNRQQIEVFTNLVIVFCFIFLGSVGIGYLVIRNITKPINALSKRLRKTTLEEKNVLVEYHSRDEIGNLVQEYNKMVIKLEKSKAALALSQKETAWKEMAKQVAHEIKNPLTPMKLKIQQLMRTKSKDVQVSGILNSLLHQIETLSNIADSFSAFAKMPVPKNEKILLSEIVDKVCELYTAKGTTITVNIVDNIYVFADASLMGRVLNNLLLNGIQANIDQKVEMVVSLTKDGDKAILSVIDNGIGIPDRIQHKIFTPYFSTKENGSGIGLAIAKKGIEQAGGSIWFETKEGEGTTFCITLPLSII